VLKGRYTLNDIIKSVKHFFKNKNLKRVYVGFSGGADSTSLLLALKVVSLEFGFQVTAVHFEHGLRGELSLADAKWCRHFCAENSINYVEYRLNLKEKLELGNVEALARQSRFEKFHGLIEDSATEAVALGHHSGDRIENLFIRLFRGSNTSALTSLRDESELYGLRIIRPLINFTKNEVECFLKENGVDDWRIDHTNAESDYRRNFFRNRVLPLIYDEIPNAEAGINRAIDVLSEDARCLEGIAQSKYAEIANADVVDVGYLRGIPQAILVRVFRRWLSNKLGYDFIPDRNFVERFYKETDKISSEKKLLPIKNSTFLIINKNFLSIFTEPAKLKPVIWDWKKFPVIVFGNYRIKAEIFSALGEYIYETGNGVVFDANIIPSNLILRSWRAGDKMIPFGKNSAVKLKKIFSDRKIPLSEKITIPILSFSAGTIICVLGVRRSNIGLINPKVKQIIRFSYEKV
jgi:tRNA(Ile)-lysidine synthase